MCIFRMKQQAVHAFERAWTGGMMIWMGVLSDIETGGQMATAVIPLNSNEQPDLRNEQTCVLRLERLEDRLRQVYG